MNNDSAGLIGNDTEMIGARIEWLIVVASFRDGVAFWSSIGVLRIRFIRPRGQPVEIVAVVIAVVGALDGDGHHLWRCHLRWLP